MVEQDFDTCSTARAVAEDYLVTSFTGPLFCVITSTMDCLQLIDFGSFDYFTIELSSFSVCK